MLLLGTQYGALSTLIPAATSDVVPPDKLGITYGLVFTGWGTAGLLAPVGAATLAVSIGYSDVYRIFLIVGALSAATAVVYSRLVTRDAEPSSRPETS